MGNTATIRFTEVNGKPAQQCRLTFHAKLPSKEKVKEILCYLKGKDILPCGPVIDLTHLSLMDSGEDITFFKAALREKHFMSFPHLSAQTLLKPEVAAEYFPAPTTSQHFIVRVMSKRDELEHQILDHVKQCLKYFKWRRQGRRKEGRAHRQSEAPHSTKHHES